MTFGEKLHKLRKEQGWTQEELASRLNISRQALSKWEQGMAKPDTENVLQVSRLFGVSTDYLLYDDYESDADIPAVKDTGERMALKLESRVRTLLGMCIFSVGVIGLMVLAVVGYHYRETYPMDAQGVETTVRGLGVLLQRYDLYWLPVLLFAAAAVGLVTMLLPGRKKET